MKALVDLAVGAGLIAYAGALLVSKQRSERKQIPPPPMDDMLTEDAIMRRLEGNTQTPERPFDSKFWTEGMGW